MGNLGLAIRAASAVSTVDVHALAMLIQKDRSSGNEELRARTFEDTLTLATCQLLMREQATASMNTRVQAQVFRAWDAGRFIKVSKWADVPAFLAALFHPATIAPLMLARWLLFAEDLNAPRFIRARVRRLGYSLIHAYDFSNRVIAAPLRGRITGMARSVSRGFRAV